MRDPKGGGTKLLASESDLRPLPPSNSGRSETIRLLSLLRLAKNCEGLSPFCLSLPRALHVRRFAQGRHVLRRGRKFVGAQRAQGIACCAKINSGEFRESSSYPKEKKPSNQFDGIR